jgi:hypothetical protein
MPLIGRLGETGTVRWHLRDACRYRRLEMHDWPIAREDLFLGGGRSAYEEVVQIPSGKTKISTVNPTGVACMR